MAFVRSTNWKSDYSGSDENEVHENKDGLELSHDLGHNGGEDGVAEDAGEEGSVDSPVGRCPVPVASDDDDGEEHQGKSVCSSMSVFDSREGMFLARFTVNRT